MKFNYKKVATIVGSALMVGATAGMAAAASLPSSFTSDLAIVVGSSAAASDNAAALSITNNLLTGLATSGAASFTGGDSVLIKSGTNNLNLGNALNIVGTINDEDMEDFLASGDYKDLDKNEWTYDQQIALAATNVEFSTSSAYEDKTPTLGLFYDKDENVLNYTVDFGGLNFTKAIGTDLPLMGNMYYVLDYDTTNGLVLLDSSASTTMTEGETTTLVVDGKSYEVTLNFVGDATTDYAKFTVNGESLDKIEEGSDDELADGAWIAVKEVLYSSKESGASQVEFTIGKGKLELPANGEIEMNDDRVVNVDSVVTNEDSIVLQWNTDAKVVLTEAGDSLTLPGFNTIKVVYNGITFPEEEKTVLDAAGVLEIETSVKDGALSLPLVNYEAVTAAGNLSYLGDDSDSKFVLGTQVGAGTNYTVSLTQTGDYFVASYISGDDYESYAYELSSIKYADGKTEVVLDNLASTDSTSDITFAEVGRSRTKGELTFTLAAANETLDTATIYVTASSGASASKIVTEEGLIIDFSGFANLATANLTTGANLTFVEEDKDGDAGDGVSFTALLTTTADENIHVSSTNVTTLETKTDDVYLGYVISDLATRVDLDKTDADAQDFAISYYGEEVTADAYVASADAVTTPTTGVMTVKDTQLASVSGKNLIVIGGSCVNSLSASLLGSTCGDSFTSATGVKAGEAIIKSFNYEGKLALLVAGYEALDTTRAATYLGNTGLAAVSGANVKLATATEATSVIA